MQLDCDTKLLNQEERKNTAAYRKCNSTVIPSCRTKKKERTQPQVLPLDSPVAAESSHCMLEPGWGAWRCFESLYAQLVFESADADRYTRSLAPVAVAGEDALGDSSLAELQANQVSRSSVSTARGSACRKDVPGLLCHVPCSCTMFEELYANRSRPCQKKSAGSAVPCALLMDEVCCLWG